MSKLPQDGSESDADRLVIDSASPQSGGGNAARQLALLDLLQPLQPTLANFVAGRNREALATLQSVAAGTCPVRIVYLWGEPGCGRTHLLRALAQAKGAYEWTPDTEPERAGAALVDDVEHLDDAAQVALFNRINATRASAAASCVVAGPAAPAQLALRADLGTRLAWGLVYRLHALSDDEKAAALATHAASRGLHVAADVIPYLLRHLPRDMRTLVAALDALDAYALARKRPLTLPLVREAFAAEAAAGGA